MNKTVMILFMHASLGQGQGTGWTSQGLVAAMLVSAFSGGRKPAGVKVALASWQALEPLLLAQQGLEHLLDDIWQSQHTVYAADKRATFTDETLHVQLLR